MPAWLLEMVLGWQGRTQLWRVAWGAHSTQPCRTTSTPSIHGTVTLGCSLALPHPRPLPGSITPPRCMGIEEHRGTQQQGPHAGNRQSWWPGRASGMRGCLPLAKG